MSKESYIELRGVRVHNLKNIDVKIPKHKLIVITGVSGSGKSSLMIDTLYAEGQRRYVESLNAYARQFLSRMNKPDIDYISGISPAIAIEQKVISKNSRSTVGTMTEIFDFLRLLYAHIGVTYHPKTGRPVQEDTVSDVIDFIKNQKEGSKVYLILPLEKKYKRTLAEEINVLVQKGFARMLDGDTILKLDQVDASSFPKNKKDLFLLIDRYIIGDSWTEEDINRLSDSILTAFSESHGTCIVQVDGVNHLFNNRFESDGDLFEKPSPNFFNFNNPYGACEVCEGFGNVMDIDEDLVIPDKKKSIYDNAVACWNTPQMSAYANAFIKEASEINFPIHRSIQELSDEEHRYLWYEADHSIMNFFQELNEQSYKIHYRVLISRYRAYTTCRTCKGSRIRKDAAYVKIQDHSIIQLLSMNLWKLQDFFKNISLSDHEKKVAKRILIEINNRLEFMNQVGLGYLTLARAANTLSGGETQRINLTRAIGSNLTNSLYILDEPSIGLHPRDTLQLIKVLKKLQSLGNTVIIVEHEEAIMQAADYIIDMGPLAGVQGGEVVAADTYKNILKNKNSITAAYLNGSKSVGVPKRRFMSDYFLYEAPNKNNLKDVKIKIPLRALTVVTGVSGSGKTTLIKQLLYPCLKQNTGEYFNPKNKTAELKGDYNKIKMVELIDQESIGISSRSNPITYVKAYDLIRELYAKQKLSKIKNYKPGIFSFNVEGGRCEACKGDGTQTVSMQFLADVHLICEECNGKRFKDEVLQVQYKHKNIFEVLEMTIDESMTFFIEEKDILARIKPLQDVGLGYVKLGQKLSTLSGGEAQRVKLASFLVKEYHNQNILFIFDEPTTGLHFYDIEKLMIAFQALIENGHTVIVIEHNMDVIKCADWIIDLGPEGGEEGGYLVAMGTPEQVVKINQGYTSRFLKEKLP